MKILIVHNAYRQRGGEEAVVDAEAALLSSRGHEVRRHQRDNAEIDALSAPRLAAETLWSVRTTRDVGRLLADFRPDVVHVHNTFPLISPSVYWAATRAGVPVVQTLHNFRWLCPQASFLRDGLPCEDCLGRLPWRGVARGCYRGSLAQTALLTGMLAVHRAAGSYHDHIRRYIALAPFCRDKLIAGGLPAERVVVKPNFVDLPPPTDGERAGGLFVGRVTIEKGIGTLLDAADRCATPLMVLGEGPELPRVLLHRNMIARGALPPAEVYAAMRARAYLVVPSLAYEGFPRAVVEAFACGLPVIASRRGSLPDLIEHGRTGLLFEPGSSDALAEQLLWADTHPGELREMGRRARAEYETRYTPEVNYRQLLRIYAEACGAQHHEEAAA